MEIAATLGEASLILRVNDLGAALTWYRDVLDVKPLLRGSDGPHAFAVLAFGQTKLCLWELPPGEEPVRSPSASYVAFGVPGGVEEIRRELTRRGVSVGKLRKSSLARFFWFYDPDGNRFEVSEVGSAPTPA